MSKSESDPAPGPYLDFPNHTQNLDTDFQAFRSHNDTSLVKPTSKRV